MLHAADLLSFNIFSKSRESSSFSKHFVDVRCREGYFSTCVVWVMNCCSWISGVEFKLPFFFFEELFVEIEHSEWHTWLTKVIIRVFLWKTFIFRRYLKSHKITSILKRHNICEGNFLPLGCSDDQSSEKSNPLRGRDRLKCDPKWFPGFLKYCSWMFPERLRSKSELVGSEETRQTLTRHPRYVTLFC